MEVKIEREVLKFILEASRETHPNEFIGILRSGESDKKITDVLLIPGSKSGKDTATVRKDMIPLKTNRIGSVHSHPSGNLSPSKQDLITFSEGKVNIIVGYPYKSDSWESYNSKGEKVDIEVIEN